MEVDGDLLTNLSKFDSTLLLRYESFKTWPKQHVITKENLSGAGFTYRNTSDVVECKTCGLRVNNWNEGDDPYLYHIKFRPDCDFASNMKNKPYVERLKWKIAWMNYEKLCKSCKKKQALAVLLPCHHASSCFDCAKKDNFCGKCNGTIRGFVGFV